MSLKENDIYNEQLLEMLIEAEMDFIQYDKLRADADLAREDAKSMV